MSIGESASRLNKFHLEVPARYLVRNLSNAYAHWWHRIAVEACIVVHLSKAPPSLGKVRKREMIVTG